MKKYLIFALIAVTSITSTAQYDEQPKDKTVAELDVVKTCKTDVQNETANKVLNYLFNFKWWHIKNMVDALHPDYVAWHSSRVFNAVLVPEEKRESLPYKDGIVTREEYLTDLAMVAYTNDVSKYVNDFQRMECVGNDTILISSIFYGLSVFRDKEGYITHKIQLKNIPVRFMVMLKDGLVYRSTFDLPDNTTADMFKSIKEEVINTPALPKDENTKTTYAEILESFKTQSGTSISYP